MIAILFLICLLLIMIGPSLWVRMVLKRHSQERHDFPGTGGEFARHILDLANLQSVPVEITDDGDHYDPEKKAVRLSDNFYNGKSLTAVVVAAHEVGHALQDHEGYQPLKIRTNFAKFAIYTDWLARGLIFISPLSFFFSPKFLLFFIGAFVILMVIRVIMHLITLPVEFDASFNKAMPILDQGNYLDKADIPKARTILTACAFTYVAAALISIIDIIRILRFGR